MTKPPAAGILEDKMYSRVCCHAVNREIMVFGRLSKHKPPLAVGDLDILEIFKDNQIEEAIKSASEYATKYDCILGCDDGIIKENEN